MTNDQKQQFARLLADTLGIYRLELTPSLLNVWWQDLKHFELDALERAFSMHRRNPDNGQFAPKPADITKLLGGTSKDRAILAWNKVKKAISGVGAHSSIVFDDPLIHSVLTDMGGWPAICQGDEDELGYRQNEFENRYRAYLFNPPQSYTKSLAGIAETSNAASGMELDPPVAFGDVEMCRLTYRGGLKHKEPMTLLDVGSVSHAFIEPNAA